MYKNINAYDQYQRMQGEVLGVRPLPENYWISFNCRKNLS